MIPVLVEGGYRVVVPDLIGFGRSDKPAAQDDYTYAKHIVWTQALLDHLKLKRHQPVYSRLGRTHWAALAHP